MPIALLASLRRMSNADLVAALAALARHQRDSTVLLVAHLAELDTRDVHLREGHGSLFAFCRSALALSEQDAYNLTQAARAARRFPVVLERLADASLNLTTLRLLAPHLTADNHACVLESAGGKTKPQVEEIVARLLPRPDQPPSIRRLPEPKAAAPLPPGPGTGAEAALPARAPVRYGVTVPLSPDRYRMQLTIGADTLEKLRLAKDMLRHAIPSGDEAAVVDRALTALLAELARRKFAAADHPRPSREPAPGSRHIPADVKRAVWLRDLGRCAFVGSSGRRCDERAFLEFHHVRPYAAGGEATVANIQLRCRTHNDYEARVHFGWDGRHEREGTVREAPAPYGAHERNRPQGISVRNDTPHYCCRSSSAPSCSWARSSSGRRRHSR